MDSDRPTLEGVEAEALFQVEIAEDRYGEQPEADGRGRDEHGLDRANAHDPLEGRLHRRRRRRGIGDDLAQHALLLELPTGGLFQAKRDEGHEDDGDGEDVEGPAPAVRPAHLIGDDTAEEWAERGGRAGAHPHRGPDAAAQRDGVGVSQERAVHHGGAGLGTPAPRRARKKTKMLMAKPVKATIRPKTKVAQATMGGRR